MKAGHQLLAMSVALTPEQKHRWQQLDAVTHMITRHTGIRCDVVEVDLQLLEALLLTTNDCGFVTNGTGCRSCSLVIPVRVANAQPSHKR